MHGAVEPLPQSAARPVITGFPASQVTVPSGPA